MTKRRNFVTLLLVLLLAFLAVNLSYPVYFDRAVDFVNAKLNLQNSKYKIPHFLGKPFRLGLDLQGGSHLLYEADLSSIDKKNYSSAMQGLRDVIERRVNLFGVQEPVVQVEEAAGHHRLIVELAGIKDVTEAIKMIGQTPFLEFREQRSEEEVKQLTEQLGIKEGDEIPAYLYGEIYFKSTELTGKYLKTAQLAFDQTTSKPIVSLQFNDEGAKIFEDLTTKNVGKPLAIFIDGLPISVPVVQGPISGGKAQITGKFTLEEAKELSRNLSAGALPVPIKLISQQTVGPILGKTSLEQSLKAGVIGFLAIIIFMILFYRLPGVLASLSLVIYAIFALAIFKLIPVTLTLAGITGFLLSIGMAVDANILIFSRMKEEMSQGKNFGTSVDEGFRKAWSSIRDGNFATILVGVILFALGIGFVKGFAFTLIIGNVISLFSAIFVTKNSLQLFVGTRLEKKKWLWG
ncbi:MAG: protein translocase subunit SecD [Candidatus Nealsonbacteria bacterium CG23_combo_of_CG06-09_8_20_14_all_38_19]|uniref:Protein translocase subunit SecD n=1 Tax=Candidatus Nealsonbacteria bacterium CG23_combo_of_CG06-09_8_20_14_all_38_19 TaxID=1974721 RepID=A0A2G9YVP1_9BACT|nr:MAG: protein translocase subunit SecD [Candidatus Nealsonbacteria bacterium CG23_combo_of_CG06-09_8_20_14_all_38_19]